MGALDWSALPVMIEMLGVKDIESFITQLSAIRDFKQRG